ncbi:hypothetical protein [Luteimonas sp. RC10]|uniref:hypothetical protein n=1 Tax=Luteimonas sp. RC10 TaxID=2587035 RepID=UPI00161E35D3|nr:hypothetical protein [Luteimonas sp. RC10]MBB3342403.1 hypothetical protein [Luteimonas sp. RC10]
MTRTSKLAFGAAGIALLLASGCTHRSHHVDRQLLLPLGAATYTTTSTQRFLMATALDDPMPAFPTDGLAEPPLRLCASFTVDVDGAVRDIVIEPALAGCDRGDTPGIAPFAHAVDAALTRWSFIAAAICTFPDAAAADGDPDCRGDDAVAVAVPVRLTYAFVFDAHTVRGRAIRRD